MQKYLVGETNSIFNKGMVSNLVRNLHSELENAEIWEKAKTKKPGPYDLSKCLKNFLSFLGVALDY